MELFAARDLAQACRIFLELAYPSGLTSIPAEARPYAEIANDARITDYLPPAAFAEKVCQQLNPQKDWTTGFSFRFGRIGFRYLKMRVRQMENHGKAIWVFSVDTHDKRLLSMPNQTGVTGRPRIGTVGFHVV